MAPHIWEYAQGTITIPVAEWIRVKWGPCRQEGGYGCEVDIGPSGNTIAICLHCVRDGIRRLSLPLNMSAQMSVGPYNGHNLISIKLWAPPDFPDFQVGFQRNVHRIITAVFYEYGGGRLHNGAVCGNDPGNLGLPPCLITEGRA